MEIKDLQGKVITVTDLEASLKMVEEFMGYSHADADENMQRFDRQRQTYWEDFYNKLQQLKKDQNLKD